MKIGTQIDFLGGDRYYMRAAINGARTVFSQWYKTCILKQQTVDMVASLMLGFIVKVFLAPKIRLLTIQECTGNKWLGISRFLTFI